MPLLPPVLQQGLLTLDEPQPPPDPGTAANAWFKAFWQYYSGCSQLLPTPLAESSARGVFIGILAPALAANQVPVPVPFFLALEGAIRASLAVTLVPTSMVPGLLVGVPSPVPLAPLMVPAAALGLASGSSKVPARAALASVISSWMYSNTITLQPPATGAIPLI